MKVLWNDDVSGFKMTGLMLNEGSRFIGYLRKASQAHIAKATTEGRSLSWFEKDNAWTKTGISGMGAAWFLGMVSVDADQTMMPKTLAAVYEHISPFDLYRLTRQGS